MVAPEGTVANAVHPAAVVGGWEVSVRWIDVFLKAISERASRPRLRRGQVDAVSRRLRGFRPAACRASPRHYYCFLETLAGGYGGRSRKDGPDAVQTYSQNTENAPVEETELNYPVRILRYELVNDSGGPGQYRGGLGLRRDYAFPDHEPTFTILADRLKFPPEGLFGGEPGRAGVLRLDRPGRPRAPARLEGDLHRATRMHGDDANLRWRRLRPARRAGTRAGAAGRDRGQGFARRAAERVLQGGARPRNRRVDQDRTRELRGN